MSIAPTNKRDGEGIREKAGKGLDRYKVCERLVL
jgi:hypothetical protein